MRMGLRSPEAIALPRQPRTDRLASADTGSSKPTDIRRIADLPGRVGEANEGFWFCTRIVTDGLR